MIGTTVVFLTSRFPSFPVGFPKIFFHKKLVLTITNTTKIESAKSAKPLRSQPVTKISIYSKD